MLIEIAFAAGLVSASPETTSSLQERTNRDGPTVQQFHDAIPAAETAGRRYPTPIQSAGPFPYFFTVEPNVAAAFLGCDPDGRCDRWVLFTSFEPMTPDQTAAVQARFWEGSASCAAFAPGIYQMEYRVITEINPQAMSLVMLTPDIDAQTSADRLAALRGVFAGCARGIRDVMAEVQAATPN
jgi:hypothetical protein